MGLASIIYDVLDDYILHASIHKFLSSERAAALEHLKVLEDMGLYNNSIIIFDRGYYSEDMFRYCVEHGHLCVMRLKEGINLSKKCNGDIYQLEIICIFFSKCVNEKYVCQPKEERQTK